MKGYKGFHKNLICKGNGYEKKYEENTVYEEEGAKICKSGMHFCNNPFDVLDYYGFIDNAGEFNEFAEVEALADCDTDDNKKYCTTKLRVGAKLSFAGFVKACTDFVKEETNFEPKDLHDNTNESGDYAQIGSSGDSAKIGSSGYSAKIGSSGDYAKIGSSGDYAQIGSSGYSAKIGSSGHSANIGSSGDYANIGSSGDYAKIGSSGDYARINSTGLDSVICCAGSGSIAKAKKGSWITLSEWEYLEEKTRYVPVCVKTEQVDGERIKEDTFYKLQNGEFVEVV